MLLQQTGLSPFGVAFAAAIGLGVLLILRLTQPKPQGNKPFQVPYRIPWLGHGLEFLKDIDGFLSWVRKTYGPRDVVAIHIAGAPMYIVRDRTLASAVYRRPRDFAFDPFTLKTARICGAGTDDMRILSRGAHGLSGTDEPTSDSILLDMHHGVTTELKGEALHRMTQIFMQQLMRVMRAQLGAQRQHVEFVGFVKRCWTVASVTTMFGTHFVEGWPAMVEEFWEFEGGLQSLLTGVPRVFNKRAHESRDLCVGRLVQWERDARQHSGAAEDELWDPYWGMRIMRQRANLLQRRGVSAQGRAASALTLLFGLNSNAIPIAIWTCIQALLRPELLASVKAELATVEVKAPDVVPIPNQSQHPHCRALFLETLRWATNAPGLRLVRHDTNLGKYTLRRNTFVYMDSNTLQTDAEVWPNPRAFDPTRFLIADMHEIEAQRTDENAEAEAQYNQSSKLSSTTGVKATKDGDPRLLSLRPFGGGTTYCPGRHFAANEMLGGLAAVLTCLDVEVDAERLKRDGWPEPDRKKMGGQFPDREFWCWVTTKD